MKRITLFACLVLVLTFSMNAFAEDEEFIRHANIGDTGMLIGGSQAMAKAGRDTAFLVAGPDLSPAVDGTFQDAGGAPNWHGWTILDWTVPDLADETWHVSDYFVISCAYSAYCGDETIPSCGAGDPDGGYDNSWSKLLKWGATITDNSLTTNISVNFQFDVDSEGGYDWGIVSRELENEEREDIWQLSGDSTGTITVPVTYAAGEYFGDLANEVGVWFIGESDAGWADGDCDFPTTGIWRIDDVTITADNGGGTTGLVTFEDQTLGPFERKFLGAVGNFAQILSGLGDPDLCIANGSPQVTFIDDGIVQPATGGSFATADNRKYAMGYVSNYTGGLTFSEQRYLRNSVVSPPIPWQNTNHDGCRLGYSYMSDAFFAAGEAGVYMEWWFRSTDGTVEDLEDATWLHSPFTYLGGPWYGRQFWEVTDYLVQGRTYIQFAVGAREPSWGPGGHNGSPSPYFDNARIETYPFLGPAVTGQNWAMAHDAFPEIGIIDTGNLGRNSIRFDMAANISAPSHEWYQNGDSIAVDVVAVRLGAGLTARPDFHYKLQRNPLFDPYRTAGLPDSGVVVMDTTFNPAGSAIADRFNVDLPDTGFLFPGDVLHYYFSAEDAIGGVGGSAPYTTTLPADIDGFGTFDDPMAYNNSYVVRGLPSVIEDIANPGEYICPPVVFWDDAESETRNTKNEWYFAFANLGLIQGEDYDTYYAKAPSSSVGTGIARRATTNQLGWYSELLYSTGYLTTTTLCNGDWTNAGSDDITRMENWLDLGEKDVFFTGNGMAYDMANAGASAMSFLNNRMGLTFNAQTHRDLLGGQLAPRVIEVAGNPVLATASSWIAFGGCPQLWDFDLVTPSGSIRLAEFANVSGVSGGYPYSPLTLMIQGNGSRVITLTSDLAYVETDPNEGAKADATLSARTRLLKDVLNYFGVADNPGQATDVPVAGRFALRNAPNPFNPVTKISYTIKAPGHLTLKIFNVRGALVKTLINDHVEADGYIEWDGTNGQGSKVSSGVYFYQAQMGGDVQVSKMALVK